MGGSQMGAQGACLQLPTIAYNCDHFAIEIPLIAGPKGHKCAQLQMIGHNLQQVALSPNLRAPMWTIPIKGRKNHSQNLCLQTQDGDLWTKGRNTGWVKKGHDEQGGESKTSNRKYHSKPPHYTAARQHPEIWARFITLGVAGILKLRL